MLNLLSSYSLSVIKLLLLLLVAFILHLCIYKIVSVPSITSSALVVTKFSAFSLFHSISLKFLPKIGSTIVNENSLKFLPLLFSKGEPTKKSFAKDQQLLRREKGSDKRFNFFKKGFKWLIILLLCYLQLKYNFLGKFMLFKQNNELLIVILVTYFTSLGIAASLVMNTVALLILNIKNDVDIDLSKIKFKFLRDVIENYTYVKRSRAVRESLKNEHKLLLKITLFVLFILPILHFV